MNDMIIGLIVIALFPMLLSVFMYIIENKTAFKKLSYNKRQIVYGILFGLLAILGTEYGIDVGGVKANARDAAPICAGLVFGPMAAIISGVIGAIERLVATAWGAGTFTMWACTTATLVSGCLTAFLKKYIYDGKKPKVIHALFVGAGLEVFHVFEIFIFRYDDATRAFEVVKIVTIPMVLVNAIAIAIAVLVCKILDRKVFKKGDIRKKVASNSIAYKIQNGLNVTVVFLFVVTGFFTYFLQTTASNQKTERTLATSLEDCKVSIASQSDNQLLGLTNKVKNIIEKNKDYNLDNLKEEFEVSEISVANSKGIITNSTKSNYINFDFGTDNQSKEFLCLLKDKKTYVQSFQPISYDKKTYMKYAGVRLNTGGFVQVGLNEHDFYSYVEHEIKSIAQTRRVGEKGVNFIYDKNLNIVSCYDQADYGSTLEKLGMKNFNVFYDENKSFDFLYKGQMYHSMYSKCEGFTVLAAIPNSEVVFSRDMVLYTNLMLEFIIFSALYILVFLLVKYIVIDNIFRINKDLDKIASGDLDVIVKAGDNDELSNLSDNINRTVDTLKGYIEKEATRIDKELSFANNIQHSALPSLLPARDEYDMFAMMVTAKEVGGDFYDFYYISPNKLVFMIADVSGKGIPAAMFMMQSKSIIKSYVENDKGENLSKAFMAANDKICEGNDAGMFVTIWLGIIDLDTGVVEYINAGHNAPVVRHGENDFEYLNGKSGLVFAAMDGVPYKKHTITLQPGDEIYLYTDGVTEATNSNEALYGEDRLLEALNANKGKHPQKICIAIKNDVDKFVGEAPQFDDITMLSLKYKGGK